MKNKCVKFAHLRKGPLLCATIEKTMRTKMLTNFEMNLTLPILADAVQHFNHLDPAKVDIIEHATKKGYVVRTSLTQVQFTENGLEKAKFELPDLSPGQLVKTWQGAVGVIFGIQLDRKLKPLIVTVDGMQQYYHFKQVEKLPMFRAEVVDADGNVLRFIEQQSADPFNDWFNLTAVSSLRPMGLEVRKYIDGKIELLNA